MLTRTPKAIQEAVVSLLAPTIPNITVEKLQAALDNLQGAIIDQKFERPLTRKEAAKALNISIPTVQRWMNSGKLERLKIGTKTVRISAASVRSLLHQ